MTVIASLRGLERTFANRVKALGPIDPGNNYASTETLFISVPFDRALLKEGLNTLAVEVHQAIYAFPPNATNAYPRNDYSDLRFDLRIVGQTASAPGPVLALATPGAHTLRTRIISLDSDSVIVNVLPEQVEIENVSYDYRSRGDIVVTDGGDWHLDIDTTKGIALALGNFDYNLFRATGLT